jgi:hypothetical protein
MPTLKGPVVTKVTQTFSDGNNVNSSTAPTATANTDGTSSTWGGGDVVQFKLDVTIPGNVVATLHIPRPPHRPARTVLSLHSTGGEERTVRASVHDEEETLTHPNCVLFDGIPVEGMVSAQGAHLSVQAKGGAHSLEWCA